jgi:hypothetical protein
VYEGVSKSFRTGRLERELQMVELSGTKCSCITILWVSLVSFAAITLGVASQRMFIVYFVIDSVREILHTPSYVHRLQVISASPINGTFSLISNYPKSVRWRVQIFIRYSVVLYYCVFLRNTKAPLRHHIIISLYWHGHSLALYQY